MAGIRRTGSVPGAPAGAVGMLEEAFGLLRSLPGGTLAWYILGTLPFCLGFLYFAADMSHGAFSHEYCFEASLGTAGLFVWMKACQSVFAGKVHDHLTQVPAVRWSPVSVARLVFFQAVFQGTGFIVLPLAFVFTIPFAGAVAIYQTGLVCDYHRKIRLREQFRANAAVVRHFTRTNWIMLSILIPFVLVIFLNIGIILFQLPFLVKMLTAFESRFTMGGFSFLNSTFLMTTACLTYLCVDPLVKTAFVLEKFYGQAATTGGDLLAELKNLAKNKGVNNALAGAILLISAVSGGDLQAAPGPEQAPSIDAAALEKQIEQVMSQRKFAWRMPGVKTEKAETGEGMSFLDWLAPYAETVYKTSRSFFKAVGSVLQKIGQWVEKWFPAPKAPVMTESELKESEPLKWMVYLMAAAFLLAAGLLFIRFRRKRPPQRTGDASDSGNITVDVSDENIRPDDLPEEKWMRLAQELTEKKEYRLALRALYLGTLSALADRHLLTIAPHKSNREYERELARRAHSRETLLEGFRRTVGYVDRVWYGLYRIEKTDVAAFAAQQKRIREFAG